MTPKAAKFAGYKREWYLQNKERILARRKERYATMDKAAVAELSRQWAAKNPEKRKEIRKRSAQKHAEIDRARHRATAAVSNALKAGKIVKPSRCPLCESDSQIQAHHYLGYAPEHQLAIQWMCRPCHERVHHG